MTTWFRFLALSALLLTACSSQAPAQGDADDNTPDMTMEPMSDQQFVAFLNGEFIPYVKSSLKQMDSLPSDKKLVIDPRLQNLLKISTATLEDTRKSIAGQAFDNPEEKRQHLLDQNQAVMKLKQVSADSIFQGYIYLGEADILPVQSLKSWHKMQVALNRKLWTNYQELLQLASGSN